MSNTTIRHRRDLQFSLCNDEIGFKTGNLVVAAGYNMQDLLVRVVRYGAEKTEVRYGVLLDIEGDGDNWNRCYMLEIPTGYDGDKTPQQQQEEKIKAYIDEMRRNWKTYLNHEQGYDRESLTVDEYDKIKRNMKSADGRFSILQRFLKDSSKFKPFTHWLFKTNNITVENFQNRIIVTRMPFIDNEKYYISLDWAVPYICYEKDYEVNKSSASSGGSDSYFYPFAHFVQHDTELTTEFTVDPHDRYISGVKLRPNNYAIMAYCVNIIDKIEKEKQKIQEKMKYYFRYVKNLNTIQTILTNHGPFAENPALIASAAITSSLINDWDGNTKDEQYEEHLLLGLQDIKATINLFGNIIKKEAEIGRTSSETVEIEQSCLFLYTALKSDYAQKVYKSLLYKNNDDFGQLLYHAKSFLLLGQSGLRDKVYDEIMKNNLYEHPCLNNPRNGYNNPGVAFNEWVNMFTRKYNLFLSLWQLYYSVREKALNGAIDNQMRRLVNFMFGGGVMRHVLEVENLFVTDFMRIYSRWTVEIPGSVIDEMNNMSKTYQDMLKRRAVQRNLSIGDRYGGAVSAALNLWCTHLAFQKAYSTAGTTEDKLKAYTAAISVVSDVGIIIAKFNGIQVGITKSVLKAAASAGARRIALTLGTLEAAVGGAGGIIGVAWYIYDAIAAYGSGRRKDALMNSIAAVGCAIATIGLFLDSTVVGILPGILCNIVGLIMVIVAEIIKVFQLHSSKIESYCRDLYTNDFDKNGMKRMEVWFEELKSLEVKAPWTNSQDLEELKKLTERVDEFIVNWDTFDKIANESHFKVG